MSYIDIEMQGCFDVLRGMQMVVTANGGYQRQLSLNLIPSTTIQKAYVPGLLRPKHSTL